MERVKGIEPSFQKTALSHSCQGICVGFLALVITPGLGSKTGPFLSALGSHAELGNARFALLEVLLVNAIGGLFKPGFAQTVNASNGLLN